MEFAIVAEGRAKEGGRRLDRAERARAVDDPQTAARIAVRGLRIERDAVADPAVVDVVEGLLNPQRRSGRGEHRGGGRDEETAFHARIPRAVPDGGINERNPNAR
ncbi:MAG: hypothetical protein AAF192_21435 [Pseudomonadota bacterium]